MLTSVRVNHTLSLLYAATLFFFNMSIAYLAKNYLVFRNFL